MFIFKEITNNVKIKPTNVFIDNMVFRLHYRLTFWFLLVCVVLVCSRQYIGAHIDCLADKGLDNVINTYCFFMTTFTVAKHHNSTLRSAHPGIGHFGPEDEVKRHAYYQWVPFVLFGQALLFYFPHYLWKNYEGGRVKHLVEGFLKVYLTSPKDEDMVINGRSKLTLKSQKSIDQRLDLMKNTFLTVHKYGAYTDWGKKLVFCEALTAINIVIQIYALDAFLDGEFLSLGVDWVKTDDEAELLDRVFPKVTKCTFRKYGKTGTIQTHDALCVMALNIINEKIYCILWFWFLVLLGLTLAGLLWRILTLALHSCSSSFNLLVWGSRMGPGRRVSSQNIVNLTTGLCFSHWLFLYYVCKNMEGNMLTAFLTQLAEELPTMNKDPHNPPPQNDYLFLDAPDNRGEGSEKAEPIDSGTDD